MNVSGFSHVTLRVRDLREAIAFYIAVLGTRMVHRGEHDAYLEWGTAWICLAEHPDDPPPRARTVPDHIAFHIPEPDFAPAVACLQRAGARIVRGPVQRGTGWSVNFLDPDDNELELHTATLAERMAVWR